MRFLVLLAMAGLGPISWIYLREDGRIRGVADAPAEPVALVLGAGVHGDRPSDLLARRLDVALTLYRTGRVRVLLVSGDGGDNRANETAVMRRYLVDRGVPDRRVVTDPAGFTTWESCARARRVYGVRRALVVSQRFHLPRALALCRAAGLDAYGVGDDSLVAGHVGPTLYGGAREILAAVKAAGTVIVRPAPTRDDPPDPAVRNALAAAAAS